MFCFAHQSQTLRIYISTPFGHNKQRISHWTTLRSIQLLLHLFIIPIQMILNMERIILGMFCYSVGWAVFLLPNSITTGGIPGVSSIVFWATGIPVQYTYFIINVFLLALALKILGFNFCIKTIWGVVTLTTFVAYIQHLTGSTPFLHNQPFMA